MKPFILFDIDNCIYCDPEFNGDIAIRPYFKDLYDELVRWGYQVRFYTAANKVHVFKVCCILRDFGFAIETCQMLYETALTRENCPVDRVEKTAEWKGKEYKYTIDEKMLEKACTVLGCVLSDIHVHIDDHPDCNKWDHQDKRIMCPPFEGNCEDTYFYEMLKRFEKTKKLK